MSAITAIVTSPHVQQKHFRFSELPNDTQFRVFHFLSEKELSKACGVSRIFSQHAQEEMNNRLYKELLLRDFKQIITQESLPENDFLPKLYNQFMALRTLKPSDGPYSPFLGTWLDTYTIEPLLFQAEKMKFNLAFDALIEWLKRDQKGTFFPLSKEHALKKACTQGNVRVVKAMIELYKVNNAPYAPSAGEPLYPDFRERSLKIAAGEGHLDIVKFLINEGADVNRNDSLPFEGHTALHRAAQNGHAAVVQVLIDHGSNVNARTIQDPRLTQFRPMSVLDFARLYFVTHESEEGACRSYDIIKANGGKLSFFSQELPEASTTFSSTNQIAKRRKI